MTSQPPSRQPARFIDRYRLFIQQRGYSYSTEKTYIDWALRFIKHCGFQKESDICLEHLENYLTYLAQERQLAPNSQKTVLSALVFLCRDFMGLSTKGLRFSRAPAREKIPVIISRADSKKLFIQLSGSYRLVAKLMYGSGLRVSEVAKLRVGHIDVEVASMLIANGKGGKDRYLPIPKSLLTALETQLNVVEQLHQEDVGDGYGYVPMSARQSSQHYQQSRALRDQYLFPNPERVFEGKCNTFLRGHLPVQKIRRHIKNAAAKAGLQKDVTCHTLRHSYATEMLKAGVDIRTVQTLLGHDSVRTTEIYTHIAQTEAYDFISPLDFSEL